MALGMSSLWRARPHPVHFGHAPRSLPARWQPARRSLATYGAPYEIDNTRRRDNTNPRHSYERRLDQRKAVIHRIRPAADKIPETNDPKYIRNLKFRQAYQDARRTSRNKNDPRLITALNSPYVPAALRYPSPHATRRSENRANWAARMIMGQDAVWQRSLQESRNHSNHFLSEPLPWHVILSDLKATTPQRSGERQVSALRIRLPDSWDLSLPDNKMVDFIDSSTGIESKLRALPDHKGGSTVVLRGWRETLAKAADELVALCKDVQIFELGEVASLDYENKQLWPKIQGAQDDGMSIETHMMDKVWAHRDDVEEPLEMRYEDIPTPDRWTSEELGRYVTKLAHSPIKTDLALALYSHLGDERQHRRGASKGTHYVDTDGVRVKLMFAVLTAPANKSLVNISMFKTAMACMGSRGGHRASASKLLAYAEEIGLPVDTETYNIMLQSYMKNREARFFYRLLRRMRARFIKPNEQTWLLFMQLLQKAEHRNLVSVALWQNEMFGATAVRRSVASIMARHDAYTAFRGRQSLAAFLESRHTRYGKDWFTTGAMRDILEEYLGFHDDQPFEVKQKDISLLLNRQLDDGDVVKTEDINIILNHCVDSHDWQLGSWAFGLLHQYGCQPDKMTYEYMIQLAINAKRPRALGLIFFYVFAERKHTHRSRLFMSTIVKGLHDDLFWHNYQPHMFNAATMESLAPADGFYSLRPAQVIETIRDHICEGYVPAQSLSSLADTALQLDSVTDFKQVTPATVKLHDPDDPDAFPRWYTLHYAYEWFSKVQGIYTNPRTPEWYYDEDTKDIPDEASLGGLRGELALAEGGPGEVLATGTPAGKEFLTRSPETAPSAEPPAIDGGDVEPVEGEIFLSSAEEMFRA